LIADPGTWSTARGIRDFVIHKLNVPRETAAHLGDPEETTIQTLDAAIRKNAT
jgi:hypothetical protein